MNLADMLSYADIHQLNRIASHYACECNSNSKRELIQSILNTINRKDRFEQYVQELSLEDIRFLNSLLYDQRELFSMEELLARARLSRFDLPEGAALSAEPSKPAPPLSPPAGAAKPTPAKRSRSKKNSEAKSPKEWTPRDMIVRFTQQGWLFNGHSQQTKFLYQVPHDLKLRFGESLARTFQKQLHIIDEPPVYRDEQGALADDLYRFLEFVHHHQIDVTSDGTMYKRSQQTILDRFTVNEELVGKGGWRFGYGRKIKEYPNRFSLIYDYCFYNGYINELPSELRLTAAGTEQVIQSKRENPEALYRFWMRLYKSPIHNLQTIVAWIDRLAQRWVTVETLESVLLRFIKPYYYDDPRSILHQRVLPMMLHLGLVRIGEHPGEGAVIQMTKLGSSIIRGVYVPEDDRILLPEEA